MWADSRGTSISDEILGGSGRCTYFAFLTAVFAAVGLLYLRSSTAHVASVATEISGNRLIYLYVFAATAAVFVTLGYALRRQIDELRQLTTTDPLTGLQNRRGLQARLRALCAAEQSAPLALLLIDVDGLKAVNDGHGHAAGDRLLHDVASAIRMTVRAADDGSRWGGDEFAIVAPRTSRDAAGRLAERLQLNLARRSRAADLAVTVSVGIVVTEPSGGQRMSADDLMRAADAALYRAKHAGRNGVQTAFTARSSSIVGQAESTLQL